MNKADKRRGEVNRPMNIYRQALDCQDACNPTGIAHLFIRVANHLREEESAGTADLCNNSALRLIADKLIDLMGRPDGAEYTEAYDECIMKADRE